MRQLLRKIRHALPGRAPRRPHQPGRQVRRRPELEPLEERQTPTVTYYGGNLLPHVEAQAVYYGNEWSSVPAVAAQTATLDAFLKDLTGGAYMDALTRAGYGVGRGTASAGAVDKAALATPSVITDASIRAHLQADVTAGLVQAPDANRLYVVYVEPNVAVNLGAGQGTTQQGVLGYHGAFAGRDAAGNAVTIHYAVIAYPGGSVGNSSRGTAATDQLTAVASHEVTEAVTDPDVNYGRLGWYDARRGEIGDITENNPNALVRLDGYLVQEVADQNDQLLSITSSPPPTTSIATTTTLTAGGVTHGSWYSTVTLTVTISPASGSVAPGGTVQLVYNGRVLGSARVRVVNGVATATFSLAIFAPGNYTFSAVYMGSGQFQGSSSNSVTVTV
jgi:Bacterial Ig-like domain (group 3)